MLNNIPMFNHITSGCFIEEHGDVLWMQVMRKRRLKRTFIKRKYIHQNDSHPLIKYPKKIRVFFNIALSEVEL